MDPPARNSSRKTSSRALAGQQHAMEMHVNRPPGFVRDPSTSSSGCPPNSPDDVGDPQRWKSGPRPALGFLGDETSKELQRASHFGSQHEPREKLHHRRRHRRRLTNRKSSRYRAVRLTSLYGRGVGTACSWGLGRCGACGWGKSDQDVLRPTRLVPRLASTDGGGGRR